jgi:hypothetical protein
MPVDPGAVEVVPGLHVDGFGPRGERRPVPTVTVVTDDGRVIRGPRVADVDPALLRSGIVLVVAAGRVPHWATCPKAQHFRGKG